MDLTEHFIAWLRDAYAMERALEDTLKKHADDAKEHPEIRNPIEEHRKVTAEHAEKVAALLEQLGEERPALKTAMARFSGLVSGLPTSLVDDTLVKNALAEFTSENFEIACYTSLITAAEDLGLKEVVPILESILSDEQDMADRLIEVIPEITSMYLQGAQEV
jgi:ferritin-like metal-binding protein YciE